MTTRRYISQREERERTGQCPKCGSGIVTMRDQDTCGKEHYESMECADCGFEYVEVYAYEFTEYTEEF